MSFRYLRSLLFKSASIQHAIEREQRAPHPDWMRLLQLKKLRLVIKDKLYRQVIAPAGNVRLAPVPILSRPFPRNVAARS